jgi:hypothetical protein
MDWSTSPSHEQGVPFHIPLSYIDSKLTMQPHDVLAGLDHGWLSIEDGVAFALRSFETHAVLNDLALAWNELPQTPWILDKIREIVPSDPCSEKKWLFLALSWIYDSRASNIDWRSMADLVNAEFGYPEIVHNVLSFAPPAQEGPTDEDERWQLTLQELLQSSYDARPMKTLDLKSWIR